MEIDEIKIKPKEIQKILGDYEFLSFKYFFDRSGTQEKSAQCFIPPPKEKCYLGLDGIVAHRTGSGDFSNTDIPGYRRLDKTGNLRALYLPTLFGSSEGEGYFGVTRLKITNREKRNNNENTTINTVAVSGYKVLDIEDPLFRDQKFIESYQNYITNPSSELEIAFQGKNNILMIISFQRSSNKWNRKLRFASPDPSISSYRIPRIFAYNKTTEEITALNKLSYDTISLK